MSDFEENYRKWHTFMSFIKSAVRIVGCLIVVSMTDWASAINILAFSLLLAEVVGIAEEWV